MNHYGQQEKAIKKKEIKSTVLGQYIFILVYGWHNGLDSKI